MPTGLHINLSIKAIKLVCHKIKGFQDEVKCKTLIGYQSGSNDLKIYMFTIQPYLRPPPQKKIKRKKLTKQNKTKGPMATSLTLPTIHIIKSALWI